MSKVLFNQNICKGCGLCVHSCPKKIIELDETKMNSKGYNPAWVNPNNMERCSGCAMCATICPDCVITIEK